ncbi:MAG: inositol monophosphatase [Saprospiraceae bacterium]
MHSKSLANICIQTCDLAAKVANFIKMECGAVNNDQIDVKGLNSLVSYVDKNAELQIVEGLQTILPEAAFLTEEETIVTGEAPYRWIIDPLDGTTNFLHQLPFFAISIALQHNEQIILGVVYEVNRKECFYAWKDGGSWLNGNPIKVSKNEKMQDALFATGFPYYDYSKTKSYLNVLEHLMKNTRGIRRFGAAALDLAYVACGRFDAFFEYSLQPWDVAAGALIVQEAGGQVCDFSGESDYIFGKEIIASSSSLHGEVRGLLISEFLKD